MTREVGECRKVLQTEFPCHLGDGLLAFELPRTSLEPPAYEPFDESRNVYEQRVKEYADTLEAAYAAAGWEETITQVEQTMHRAWLARRDVGGESTADIARSPDRPREHACGGMQGRDKRSVRYGVAKVRELIGKEDPQAKD